MHSETGPPNDSLVAVEWGAALVFACTAALSLKDWHGLDYGVTHFLNRFAQHSVFLDHAIGDFSKEMFSNLLIVTLVWYAWFQREDRESRAAILVGVVVSFLSGIVSRGLQVLLPTHLRPLHDPALQFRPPFGVNSEGLNHWSSFPSDHAAVFFGLAMTVWLVNRRAGWLAMAVAVFINFVRIYLGFHYLSDVLGGAMLGILLVAVTYPLRHLSRVLRVAAVPPAHRAVFYAVCFYLTFGIVTLMQDLRDVASGLAHFLHHGPA